MPSFELIELRAFASPSAVLALTAWAAGFGVCLSLLISIGAQNLYVLRQALLGQHVQACVIWCVASDAVLVTLGVHGMAQLAGQSEAVKHLLGWSGAAFLIAYGAMAWRRAWLGKGGAVASGEHSAQGAVRVIGTLAAVTLLNPQVYLDTLVLIGSVGAQQPQALRWVFVAGAVSASLLWFLALTTAARRMRAVFASPQAWRVLDSVTGVMMFALAAGLLRGVV